MSAAYPDISLGRSIRSARRVKFFAYSAWAFALWMVVLGAATVPLLASREGPASASAGALFFAVLAVSAGWYGARLRHAELRIDAGAVLVRNPIQSHLTALEQVEGFEPGNVTPRGGNGTPGVVLRLKGGALVPVWALGEESSIFSIRRKTAELQSLADTLNDLLAQARRGRA